MILLVGNATDETLVYLGWLAELRGSEVAVLPEDRFGLDWTLQRSRAHSESPGEVEAVVVHGRRIAWADVDGAVVRLDSSPAVHPTIGIVPKFRRLYATARRAEIERVFADAPFTVVNRPDPDGSTAGAIDQLERLATSGFAVPDTVVTADPDEAKRFVDRHCWNVIAKSVPGFRPFVGWWSPVLAAELRRVERPVLLQEFVSGDDVHVHVVGDTTFGTSIAGDDSLIDSSDSVEPAEAVHAVVEPPALIRQLCLIHTRCLGRTVAAFRFRVTIDGTWLCLGMDADPQIVQFEIGAGHRIGEAVLDLISPSRSTVRVSVREPRTTRHIATLSELVPA